MPPTPSFAFVVKTIAVRSTHFILDSGAIFVAVFFPLACLTVMFWGKVVATREAVRVAVWMATFRTLAVGQVVVVGGPLA